MLEGLRLLLLAGKDARALGQQAITETSATDDSIEVVRERYSALRIDFDAARKDLALVRSAAKQLGDLLQECLSGK